MDREVGPCRAPVRLRGHLHGSRVEPSPGLTTTGPESAPSYRGAPETAGGRSFPAAVTPGPTAFSDRWDKGSAIMARTRPLFAAGPAQAT